MVRDRHGNCRRVTRKEAIDRQPVAGVLALSAFTVTALAATWNLLWKPPLTRKLTISLGRTLAIGGDSHH
jgi:hypothetical protein